MGPLVWIAMLHVKPTGNESVLAAGTTGAYTNVVALANGVSEFEEKIRNEIRGHGLDLLELEDAEPFDQWAATHDVSAELYELVESVKNSPHVGFDAFYSYDRDDEVQ